MEHSPLSLIIGPDPIFRQKANEVTEVDDQVRQWVSDMFTILYKEKGLGLGANMVGLLKRIIVIDLQENGVKSPIAMINPVFLDRSQETDVRPEGSLSFPGIQADIPRSVSVSVRYLDLEGTVQEVRADAMLARVIQHEMDYLDGRTFLDHLSRTRRQSLLRKAAKLKRQSEKP